MENSTFKNYDFHGFIDRLNVIKLRLAVEDVQLIDVVIDVIMQIERNPDYWDESCQFSKRKYSKHFIEAVVHLDVEHFDLSPISVPLQG